MANVKVAAIQMSCEDKIEDNLKKAEIKIKEASDNGTKIILLPELFESKYFCQERKYENYDLAKSVDDNLAIALAKKLAKQLDIVLLISFYERDLNVLYNSLAYIDDSGVLDIYRKTHIPDDHFYQEKFYFTPGNTGFKVVKTKYGTIGAGICWDQWFPETVRSLALKGAEIVFFPTAIGSEPILNVDSKDHWQTVMKGHSAANIVPIVCANRIGLEEIKPCIENSNQSSSLNFYGSSFICDDTGKILIEASRDKEEIIYADFDLDKIKEDRLSWGLFRDRRPEAYDELVK